MGNGTGGEIRVKLGINRQKQTGKYVWISRAGGKVCCSAVSLVSRHLPESLNFLRCFLGHGGKDWPPPAHLFVKNELRLHMQLRTSQRCSIGVTLTANTRSKADGAALGSEPRRTRTTCVVLCWLRACGCWGRCQQARVHASHWSQQPCCGRNRSCLPTPSGRATFPWQEKSGVDEQRCRKSPSWAQGNGISPSFRIGEVVRRSWSQYCLLCLHMVATLGRAWLLTFTKSSREVKLFHY